MAFVAAVLQIGLLWGTTYPLGLPGEWTWERIAYTPDHLWGWLTCAIAGIILSGVVWKGSRRIHSGAPVERTFWVLALIPCGVFWMLTVIGAAPEPAGLGRAPFVLYYPRSSGYYWQARYTVSDLGVFLKGYETSIQDSSQPDNYLHLGTHPPGLTTGCFLLHRACEWSPALVKLVLSLEPRTTHEAFLEIAANSRNSGQTLSEVDEAALWLVALIVLLGCATTSVPLYLLVSYSTGDREWAWFIAALWPAVPGLSVFFPKSDVLFPLIAASAQWLWILALDRKSLLAGIASATTLMLGMFLSLAHLPVAAMFGLQMVLDWRSSRRFPVRPVAGAILGVASLIALMTYVGSCDILGIWMKNVRNHAAFYDHNTRHYFAWLLINPLEISLATGLPVVCVVILRLWENRSRISLSHRAWGVVLIWLVLWLSGKNMGEAARLWCFLMPLLLWSGASLSGSVADTRSSSGQRSTRAAEDTFVLLLIQLVVCAATVTRVDGFHLHGF